MNSPDATQLLALTTEQMRNVLCAMMGEEEWDAFIGPQGAWQRYDTLTASELQEWVRKQPQTANMFGSQYASANWIVSTPNAANAFYSVTFRPDDDECLRFAVHDQEEAMARTVSAILVWLYVNGLSAGALLAQADSGSPS